ncbi:energy-coupled thiamine transporter ThiT [Bacillus lacus]|uniref:Energy-coupled thiamine transporter ThiT n=1 Tax=Metabacillus lacus TaxID=1983721 RepID=A0A7X2J254_9BACI|nr:energy-coupled thiamine transporter ThiT [Metabacillus lacus]MRX74088.1 energy-coupled thiamine transporter ThiT [Metabacillus lacus]
MNNKRLTFMIEVSILTALAFLLDLLSGVVGRFWAQGGSISLAMIPVFLLSFRWGLKGGLASGFLLGLLQVVLGTAYIAHPVQAFIDYFLAFTLVGMSGLFFKNIQQHLSSGKLALLNLYIILAVFLGSVLRYAAHVAAGVVFFGAYAPEGTPVLAYSLGYNATYMVPSFIVCAIVLVLLLSTAPRLAAPRK